MPFNKEQLKYVDFYQKFVNELRDKYLDRVKELKSENFRRNGILYSFEDIISTNGIEDANIEQDGLYESIGLDENDLEASKTISNVKYPVYVSNSLLEKTINRNIVELAQSEFANVLPEDVSNGDVVSSDDFDDKTIFLISNNQKKPFDDVGIFYAEYDVGNVKTVEESQLNLIPTGEAVE